MPPAADWRVEGDVIVLGALRVTVERIAASHWQADARLRSWGQVPLHRERDAVLAPCAPGECLWLGAWLEEAPMADPAADPTAGGIHAPSPPCLPARTLDLSPAHPPATPPARLTLRDQAGDGRAVAVLPAAYQLGALRSEHGPPEPLHLPAPDVSRCLALELESGTTRALLALVLLPPAAWAARTGRPVPSPLAAPPPLPPRLG